MFGKNVKYVLLINCLILLTVGLKPAGTGLEKANPNHEINVGIYSGRRCHGAKGLYQDLKNTSGIKVSFIKDFSNSSLRNRQVIIIPCWAKGKGKPNDWRQRLRAFVKSGGGIILTHNSVGYQGGLSDNLFPEIAGSKGGGRFDTYEPFTAKDKTHQVARELNKLRCAYGDYIGMRNGPDGKVIFEDSSGYGVVVAGRIGKGRVVMTGIPLGIGPGAKEMPPLDSEKRLLVNSITWAGNGLVVPADEFDKILNAEKLATEIKHKRDTLFRQLEVAGNELETLLDTAEFNLEQARSRIPSGKFRQYLAELKIKRKKITREIDAAKQQYSDEFSPILQQLDANFPLSRNTIGKLRRTASKLPNPKFSDLFLKQHVRQYFGVSRKLVFSVKVNLRERQKRYFPPVKKLKDKLAAGIKPLCDEIAGLRTANPDSAAAPRKFASSASWLQNTYLLDMDDKGFTVDMRMEDVVRYLAHCGFNIVEQHPEIGDTYLRKLDGLLAPYGIKQIFWPAGRKYRIIAAVGKTPEKPYVFNPEMLTWRKRMVKYTYETTKKVAPHTFLGLQFDEVLIENVTLARQLMPENISPDDRNYVGKKFQEYLQQKYSRPELRKLDLAANGKIHVPFPGDRKGNKVLWMEYQEFISDTHYRYWKQVNDYAHRLDKDIVVWLLLNRGCFVCHPFTSRWSRLASIPDVVASSLWMGGSPSLAFFLDLLRTNSRGISVFTSCTAHDGTIDTYRRALAISRAHSQGNHFFSWPLVFKFAFRGSIRTAGEQLIDTPRKIWNATVEHAKIVNKTMPYLVKTFSPAPIALLYSERNVTLQDYTVPYTTYGPYIKNQTGLYLAFAHVHIPADLLFLDGLKPERLAKYKVVVLSGAGAMTPREVKLIKDWVKNGGSLIASGGVSLLDRWGREQKNYQLADVFGCSFKSCGNSAKILAAGETSANLASFSSGKYDEIIPTKGKVLLKWDKTSNPAFIFNQYGKGACWFLGAYQPGLSLTASGMNVRSPFARNIKYFPGFLSFFRKCILTSLSRTKGRLPFTVKNCPETVEITLRQQKSNGKIIFHLINHSLDNLPVTGVKLGIPRESGKPVKVFYGIDKKPVKYENDEKSIWMQIRGFDTYEMVIVEL